MSLDVIEIIKKKIKKKIFDEKIELVKEVARSFVEVRIKDENETRLKITKELNKLIKLVILSIKPKKRREFLEFMKDLRYKVNHPLFWR